ncbi:hypothetical protein ACIP1U_32390 [Cupriavidus sp. NPDC089707]|uniref:hypothetical protein n=1 Tax=Cupriavidus sp. NPDC089707 TaxID=3363963 RepID=UPI00382AB32E
MDDTLDKLRRNTVVLSAAIIAAWWLQLKVPEQLRLLGLTEGLPLPAPWRVWVAVAAVHLYCFVRYYLSGEGTASRDKWRSQYSRLIRDRILRLLRQDSKRATLGQLTCFPTLSPPKAANGRSFHIHDPASVRGWTGTVAAVWQCDKHTEELAAIGKGEYAVPWIMRMHIRAVTLRDMTLTTHSALEFFWPVLLFVSASCIIVLRLWTPH